MVCLGWRGSQTVMGVDRLWEWSVDRRGKGSSFVVLGGEGSSLMIESRNNHSAEV